MSFRNADANVSSRAPRNRDQYREYSPRTTHTSSVASAARSDPFLRRELSGFALLFARGGAVLLATATLVVLRRSTSSPIPRSSRNSTLA